MQQLGKRHETRMMQYTRTRKVNSLAFSTATVQSSAVRKCWRKHDGSQQQRCNTEVALDCNRAHICVPWLSWTVQESPSMSWTLATLETWASGKLGQYRNRKSHLCSFEDVLPWSMSRISSRIWADIQQLFRSDMSPLLIRSYWAIGLACLHGL